MTSKVKHGSRAVSVPAGIGIGIGISLIMTLAGAAVLAYLIVNETVSQEGIGYGTMIILTVSSALGALAAWWMIRQKRAMVCGLAGIGYYLILLIITVFFFGGEFTGVGIGAVMVLLGSGLAILPVLRKKGRGNKLKIPAYR